MKGILVRIARPIDRTLMAIRRHIVYGGGPTDLIRISSSVSVSQGGKTTHLGSNHLVDSALLMFDKALSYTAPGSAFMAAFPSATEATMTLGTDTTTTTSASTTALAAPIGTGIGTSPNAGTVVLNNPAGGTYNSVITATWNAGTVSGTIGEIGLYAYGMGGPLGNSTSAQYLFSRLSVADGSFTAFTINTSLALTVTWTITFAYA